MKNLILIALICISAAAYGQKNDCEKFRDGKFIVIDSVAGNTIIERKGSKQTEYGGSMNMKLEFKVKWIDSCIYTLELKKIIENPLGIVFPEGMILTVEIIETKENSYLHRTTSNLIDAVLEGEIVKTE